METAMQIKFTRWCVDPKGRTLVSVDPTRVDATEHFSDSFNHGATAEHFPAATKIILKNKQEYIVQGLLSDVVDLLNAKQVP
jgi:hypothetical protein